MSVKNALTRTIGRQVLKIKKNSPHICFAGGVIGILGGTVLACRATLRVEPVLDDVQSELVNVHAAVNRGELGRRDLAYVYAKSAGRVGKEYAPAALVIGGSLALLTSAHVQLSRRNTALTLAYSALHQAYNEYRDRVRAVVGEDKERDLYFGVATKAMEDDLGEKYDVRSMGDPNKMSPYARVFDELNPNWVKDAEINHLFIKANQNFANDKLRAQGYLFLNDVYDLLGIDRCRAGQVVGWVIGTEGDNYVDFGLFNPNSTGFVHGWERSILLDFNVDGVVLDKI